MEVSELQEADSATISSPYHADVFSLISGFGTNHHDMTLSLGTRDKRVPVLLWNTQGALTQRWWWGAELDPGHRWGVGDMH